MLCALALSAVYTSDAFQSIRTTRNAFLPSSKVMDSASSQLSTTAMFGKKSARKGGGGTGAGGGKPRGQQQQQEKQSVKDARFDAATRQFMFTMSGLTKMLPDKSKKILDNIYLSFYPGAKIGVVGLNGSGKSTMLKIMAGVEKEFEGTARPLPGASIGYLPQEPQLEFETVQECVDDAVKSSQAVLDQYNELSMKLADPDITEDEMTSSMEKIEKLNDQIEAGDLWELERVVARAMDAL
jgi:sulfate-transporting ATPase